MSTLLSVEALVVEHRSGLFGGRRHRAVRGVSFDVAPGEVVACVGPSGCGKTSLLRAACGLLPRASGKVLALGIDPARARRPPPGVQLVVQDAASALHPGLTVRGALAESARVHRPGEPAAVATALDQVGLAHRADARPAELSGGERRRVTLASLWLARPRLTLLDEPTAGLDAPRRAEFLDQLVSRHDATSATMIVTHDLVAAVHVCSRLLFMDEGELVADLPVADVDRVDHPVARRLLAAARL